MAWTGRGPLLLLLARRWVGGPEGQAAGREMQSRAVLERSVQRTYVHRGNAALLSAGRVEKKVQILQPVQEPCCCSSYIGLCNHHVCQTNVKRYLSCTWAMSVQCRCVGLHLLEQRQILQMDMCRFVVQERPSTQGFSLFEHHNILWNSRLEKAARP